VNRLLSVFGARGICGSCRCYRHAGNCAYFWLSERIMSDKFESLDANEKAAVESTLHRCRVLATKIANELRNKESEHFVDKLSLADIHASLEHAAWVVEQKTAKGLQERSRQRHR
jgi:hypothetical protein